MDCSLPKSFLGALLTITLQPFAMTQKHHRQQHNRDLVHAQYIAFPCTPALCPISHRKPTSGSPLKKISWLQQLPTQLRLFFFGVVHAFQLSLFAFRFFSCRLFFFQQYGRCPERGTKKRNHHGTKAQKPRPWIQQNSNDHCFEPGSILRQSLKHFFGRLFGSSGGLHVVALSGVVNLVWPSSVDSVFAYSIFGPLKFT